MLPFRDARGIRSPASKARLDAQGATAGGTIHHYPRWLLQQKRQQEAEMADGGGASGVLGVLVGALLVIFVGAAVLFGTGRLGGGNSGPTLTIKMPDAR